MGLNTVFHDVWGGWDVDSLTLPNVERLFPVLSKIGKDLRPFVGGEDQTIDL